MACVVFRVQPVYEVPLRRVCCVAGPTVAKALSEATKASPNERARILEILYQYHVSVMSAFIEEGLIHSDIHLGNAVVETKKSGVRF